MSNHYHVILRVNKALAESWDDFTPKQWLILSQHFDSRFRGTIGIADHLRRSCHLFGRTKVVNVAQSRLLFGWIHIKPTKVELRLIRQ